MFLCKRAHIHFHILIQESVVTKQILLFVILLSYVYKIFEIMFACGPKTMIKDQFDSNSFLFNEAI